MAKQFTRTATSYTVEGAEARFIDTEEQAHALEELRNEVPNLANARIEAQITAYKQEVEAKYALKTALNGLLKASEAQDLYTTKQALQEARTALEKNLKDNTDADARRWSVIAKNKSDVEVLQKELKTANEKITALENTPGGGGGLEIGDTGWMDIKTGQVGAGSYEYRVVGAEMFIRRKGDEWRGLPKPNAKNTLIATLPRDYGKLERATTMVLKKDGDNWISDGSMIEVWPNWTVKYTCMDLTATYAMDLLQTTVENPLIKTSGGASSEEIKTLTSRVTTIEAQAGQNHDTLVTVANTIEALTKRITEVEKVAPQAPPKILVLGRNEALPEGTQAGTVIVRRSS